MHEHPILVTGAAGRVGSIGPAIVESLLARGLRVRAMVRQQDARSQRLAALGAEIACGDLLDLHAMHRAMEGCRRIYFSMSVGPAYLEATVNAAAVARHHGVEAFVNMSQMTVAEMDIARTTPSPQHKHHWLGEQALAWSGLPVATLRPTAFMDVFFLRFAIAGVKNEGRLPLPFGTGRTSPIAAADVARVAAEVLADPAPHIGQHLHLTGRKPQTLDEVAADFSQALGRPIRYDDVPPGPWEEKLAAGASSPHLAAHLIAMAGLHRQNRYDRCTDTVERLTGTPPLSIAEFARRHAADFGMAAHH